MDANGDGTLNVSKSGYAIASGEYRTNATPFPAGGIPVARDDSLTAYKSSLRRRPVAIGCRSALPLRDELDSMLVSNVVKQLRHHVHNAKKPARATAVMEHWIPHPRLPTPIAMACPTFGKPRSAQIPNPTTIPTEFPTNGFTSVGYTLLEEYLHFLATPHAVLPKSTAAKASSLEVDLRKYTYGFTLKPPVAYSLTNASNGTAKLRSDFTARFVPTPQFLGRAALISLLPTAMAASGRRLLLS